MIEFKLDGTIVTANQNLLDTVGYRLDEIQGKHHSMFVDKAERESAAYREFWAKLNRGEFQSTQYKRFGKGGREVWIQASYNPIPDSNGKPFKVVKYASDVTTTMQGQQALQVAVTQTQDTVKRAIDGDLTQRIPMAGKTGDLEALEGGELRLPAADVGTPVTGNIGQRRDVVAANGATGLRQVPLLLFDADVTGSDSLVDGRRRHGVPNARNLRPCRG